MTSLVSSAYHPLQLDYLEEHEVLEDGYDICRDHREGIFSSHLRTFIWVLDLSEAEFNVKKGSNPESAALDMKKKDSVRFLELLRDVCHARLNQYPTSLQEDEQLAQKIEQNPPQNISDYRMTMALFVRIGEKQILHDAMMKASATHIDAVTKHAPHAASTAY